MLWKNFIQLKKRTSIKNIVCRAFDFIYQVNGKRKDGFFSTDGDYDRLIPGCTPKLKQIACSVTNATGGVVGCENQPGEDPTSTTNILYFA